MEALIAEDLLLLLLDGEKGTMASAAKDRDVERPLFGGALLIELALDGRVELEAKSRGWRTAKVGIVHGEAPDDPLLAGALAIVAEKPRSARALTTEIGRTAREHLLERLVERGVLERREGRILGLFPHTTWPTLDRSRERAVRARLQDVLIAGIEPDARTGALVALLAEVDQAHRVVERGTLTASEVKDRAAKVSEGEWAATAVRDAVRIAKVIGIAGMVATGAVAAGGS